MTSIYLIAVVCVLYSCRRIIYRSNAKLVPRQKPRLLYHHIAYSDWRHMHANCDGFKGKWLGMGASSSTFGLWRLPPHHCSSSICTIARPTPPVLDSPHMALEMSIFYAKWGCTWAISKKWMANSFFFSSSSSFGRSFSPSLFAAFIMHPKLLYSDAMCWC